MKDQEEVEGGGGSVRNIAHRYEGGDGEVEEAGDEMGADAKVANGMTLTESGNHWMPKSASTNAARMASASDEEDEGFVPEKPPLRSGSLRNDPSNRLKRSNTFQGQKSSSENPRVNGARSFYQKTRLASSADKGTDAGNPRTGSFQRSNTFHNVELRAVEHDKPRRLSRGASFMRAREGIPQPDDASYEVPLRATDRRRTLGDVASATRRSPPGGSPPQGSKPADGENSDCEKCRSSAQKIARLKDVIRVQSMQIAEKRAERTVSARHSTTESVARKKSWFSSSSSTSKTAEIELLKQEVEKLRIVNEFLFRELSQNR